MSEQPQQPYGPPQQCGGPPPRPYGPPMSAQDERTWGVVGHLSWLAAGLVALPFLGPLVVFLVFKDRSRFVRGHAAEALNMNIALIAYEVVLFLVITVLAVVTLGLGAVLYGLLAVPGLVYLVFSILAAVAASQGREYRYPLIFRLVR